MPWKEKTVEAARKEFVERLLAKEASMSGLCREYGISRPTGYEWLKRYQSGQLSNKSHARHEVCNRTAAEMESLILQLRKQYPTLGAVKIRRILINRGYEGLPCSSTINAILKRNGCITPEASQAATPYKRFQKSRPNEMWQMDFKGDFVMQDGKRCYPLSVIDDYSRFCLNADPKPDLKRKGTEDSLIAALRSFGKPQIILCDNGNPWGTSQSAGYTGLEVKLMEHDILTIHISPKHPQTQGKVERFNGSYKQEHLAFHLPRNLAHAHALRQEYRDFYNNERPHYALQLDTPAKHYTPSTRAFQDNILPWDYPAELTMRKIKSSGYLTYANQGYFISEAFGEKTVALCPSSKDGFLNVIFRGFRIARIDLRERAVVSRRAYLLLDDPRFLPDPPFALASMCKESSQTICKASSS